MNPHAVPPTHLTRRSGAITRAHTTTVELRGVVIDVTYWQEGAALAATEVDEASTPYCHVVTLEIGGVDVTELLSRDVDVIGEMLDQRVGG